MNQPPVPQPPQADEEIELREVWNILLRNRWIILGSIVLAGALGVGLTLLATPVYEASTAIRIDEEESSLAMLDILTALSPGSQVETEMEVLRTRLVAEEVVDSLALRVSLDSPHRVPRHTALTDIHASRTATSTGEAIEYEAVRQPDGRFRVKDIAQDAVLGTFSIGERMPLEAATAALAPGAAELEEVRFSVHTFEDALTGLRDNVAISRPNREANVVVARYESPDTRLVHEVPNALARSFIRRRNDAQKMEATSTVAFLTEQSAEIAAQLATAEDALQAFREGEQVVSLEAEASAQVQRMAQLQADHQELDAERAALQQLVNEIRASTAGNDPDDASPYRRLIAFPSLLRNQAASELLRSLHEAERARSEVANRRTAQHPDVQALDARIGELERQLRSIAMTYLEGLTNQVRSIESALVRFGDQLERIPAKEVQFARLQRQASVLQNLYELLQTRMKEAEIAQAVESGSIMVVDPAVQPEEPIAPRGMLNVFLALVLGTMLGLALAFLREYMDSTVHTREDLEQATGAPALGMIPSIRWRSEDGKLVAGTKRRSKGIGGLEGLEERLVTGHDPRNPVSEAYRALRTNLTFLQAEEPHKTFVVSSPTPGDGKSTTAANLAVTLVQQGHKVLLVDADLRRGVMNALFRVPREPGLSNVLLLGDKLESAISSIDLGESGWLDVLPTGTLPPNPAELLGSKAMRGLLESLKRRYDAVILDTAPVNVVTDAAVLGRSVDGVLLVARAGVTDRRALEYAAEQFRRVRAPFLGTVLNDLDFEQNGKYYGGYASYGYTYEYYYGSDGSAREKVKA